METLGIKPIETRYDGHLFRSRREARQAVFFNELGIAYHYEPEGYELEGVRYLPDFYLPRQDSFVEVKGQYPTVEEMRKAKLLSLYTGKRSAICFGELEPPGHKLLGAFGYSPPFVTKERSDHPSEPASVLPHILITLQKLHDGGYDLGVDEQGLCALISYVHLHQEVDFEDEDIREKHTFEDLIHDIEQHYHDGQQGLTLLRQHHQEIVGIFAQSGHSEVYVTFHPQKFSVDFCWQECEQCHYLDCRDWAENHCPICQGLFNPTTQRLLDAYEAASSARFEYGWKGRTSK